jgi:hypothetical protein
VGFFIDEIPYIDKRIIAFPCRFLSTHRPQQKSVENDSTTYLMMVETDAQNF